MTRPMIAPKVHCRPYVLSSTTSRSVPRHRSDAPLIKRGVSAFRGVSLPVDDANLDAMVTRSEGAYLLGVAPGTIGMWRARGWVDNDGTRQHLTVSRAADGTLRYRYGDLLAAEHDTRRSGTPRRRVRVRPHRRSPVSASA